MLAIHKIGIVFSKQNLIMVNKTTLLYVFAPIVAISFTSLCNNNIKENTQILCFSCMSDSHLLFLQHVNYTTEKNIDCSLHFSKAFIFLH